MRGKSGDRVNKSLKYFGILNFYFPKCSSRKEEIERSRIHIHILLQVNIKSKLGKIGFQEIQSKKNIEESLEMFDKKISSKRYGDPFIHFNSDNSSHTYIIELTGVHKNILEIGTSIGNVSKVLSERENSVTGIEIDFEAAAIAKEYCERMITGDVEIIELDQELEALSFDVIVCGDVLEHLKNPADLLKKVKKYLKPDGYLVISLPNFCHGDVILNVLQGDFKYTSMGLLDETHLRFFGLKNIIKLFSECGYQIKDMHTTNISIGTTELKLDKTKIPRDLLKFIQSLPDSAVYQYIFRAYPLDKVLPMVLPETDIITLFSDSLLELKQEIQAPLETKIDYLNNSITDLEKNLLEQGKQNEELERVVAAGMEQLEMMSESNASLMEGITSRDQQLERLSVKIENVDQQLTEKIRQLEKISITAESLEQQLLEKLHQLEKKKNYTKILEETLSLKETQVQDLTGQLNDREQKLVSIEQSIIWQLTMTFHNRVIEMLLPQNTRRRRYYDIGRDGGKILLNNGCYAFYRSIVHHFNKNNEMRNYQKWVQQNEPLPEELIQLKKISHTFPYRPRISIILPVWNTDEKWLCLAIDSVLNQVYDNWELCIADGSSTKPHIPLVLNRYTEKDPRIRVKILPKNKGISENSNEALSLATGEFIGFLDHDDELAPFALYEVVKLLNQHTDADVVYSDEDKITTDGVFCDPFYKPDWSPEYFRGVMYVGHLLIVRKSLGESVGFFDTTFDFVQDYEFMLRLSEKTNAIYHIPKILYHWRKIRGSIALITDSKGDISEKQVSAVNSQLKRLGLPASARPGPIPHRVIIKPSLRSDYPLVSIIIPTKDKPELIERCLQSIYKITTYPNFEVIIIDNGTTDPAAKKIIDACPCKKIPYFEKFNFSKVNNIGAKNAKGDYVIFLNNDTQILSGDWIHNLLYYAEQGDIAAVGPLLKFPDNKVQHAGVVLGFRGTADHIMRDYPSDCDGYAGSLTCAREVSAVTAACMMVKKSVFMEVGGFNEYYSVIYQDVDLCLKFITRGYRIIFNPRVIILHYECSTRDKHQYDFIDRTLLLDQWDEIIDNGDKYYNNNFDVTKYCPGHTGYTVTEKEVL